MTNEGDHVVAATHYPPSPDSDGTMPADRETVDHARAALEGLAEQQRISVRPEAAALMAEFQRTARREDRPDPVFQDIHARLAAIRHNILADREHHVMADIVEVLARRLEALERRVGELKRTALWNEPTV